MCFPVERVKRRLFRAVFIQIAVERQSDQLAVEERYFAARTALLNLHRQEPGMAAEIKRILLELLPMAQEYLREATAVAPRAYVKRLAKATDGLSRAAQRFFDEERIRREDVALFLRVIELYRERCLAERYDPSDIVEPEILLFAEGVLVDYGAYEKELNMAV